MSSSAVAFAQSSTSDFYVVKVTDKFEKADLDTVVAIIDGVSITKRDIIGKDKIKVTQSNSDFVMRSLPDVYRLPSAAKNANVVKTLNAPRFSQVTTYMYLSSDKAHAIASDLDFDVMKDGIWFLAGFIPKVGPIITIGAFFGTWRNANLASDIRSYADKGDSCIVKDIETSYGNFSTVLSWDGKYVDLSEASYESLTSFSHD